MSKSTKLLTLCAFLSVSSPALAASPNAYVQHNLIANKSSYGADQVDKNLIDAWGIAIRPAGAGGHFWVGGKDLSFEYIGDVTKSPDEKLRKLSQDEKLKTVKVPVGGSDHFTTGIAFVDSKNNFVITQSIKGVDPVTAPSKFIFASDGGVISAWTERKHPDGTFDRSGDALSVIDQSKEGAQFFGVTLNDSYDRMYVADFGAAPGIKVFGGDFKPLDVKFDMPFDDNKNGKVDPGEYAPFNIQNLPTSHGGHIFVSYAKTQACPAVEVKKGTCKEGALFEGEEDTDKPGQGRVAEFTTSGRLLAVWKDAGKLSAPWGMAFAPKDFGALSGDLLVANFGDGSIAAFNPETREFVDVLRDAKGKPIKIEKIWGLIFGNGVSLGDENALYFSAGPDDEKDGLFGSLRLAQ